MPTAITEQEIAERVTEETQALVDEVIGGDTASPPVRISTVAGSAAQVLVNASRHADLLVVGHRGRGGFPSALGSVALRCVLHAACSVTVVRPSTRPTTHPTGPAVPAGPGRRASRP